MKVEQMTSPVCSPDMKPINNLLCDVISRIMKLAKRQTKFQVIYERCDHRFDRYRALYSGCHDTGYPRRMEVLHTANIVTTGYRTIPGIKDIMLLSDI